MVQMAKEYWCKRKRRRWPMTYLKKILDLSRLCAHIIFKDNKPNLSKKNAHKYFIRDVAATMSTRHLQRQNSIPTLSKSKQLKLKIESTLNRIQRQPITGTPIRKVHQSWYLQNDNKLLDHQLQQQNEKPPKHLQTKLRLGSNRQPHKAITPLFLWLEEREKRHYPILIVPWYCV